MPYTEDRYYQPNSTMYASSSKAGSSSARPGYFSSSHRASYASIPQPTSTSSSHLAFTDPATLLNYMSSLPSPQQLLPITHLTIAFPAFTLSRQMVHQVAMGVHLLLRYVHNLQHLNLDWADAPSSVLTGTSFRLISFSSPLLIDATVISFLEAQPTLRSLALAAWGAHLAPYGTAAAEAQSGAPGSSSKSEFSMPLAPSPPILSPQALPSLHEYTGHAEVASQLAAGGRPLHTVHLTSGLPLPASQIGSSTCTAAWREIMSGLGSSPAGVHTLTIGTLGSGGFGLEMLAEIGRFLHELDYLYVRIRRAAIPDMFRFEHWKNYLTTLASLEHIDIELVEPSPSSSSSSKYPPLALPTATHVATWQRSCPLLTSVSLSTSSGQQQGQGQAMDLVMWEWKGSKWVDRVSGMRG